MLCAGWPLLLPPRPVHPLPQDPQAGILARTYINERCARYNFPRDGERASAATDNSYFTDKSQITEEHV